MTIIAVFLFLTGIAGSMAAPQIRGQVGVSPLAVGRSVITQRPVVAPVAPAAAPRQIDEPVLVNIALARSSPDEPAIIIKQTQQWSPDRGYQYSYETENGIQAYETAELRDLGRGDVGPAVSGGYSFTGDDDRVYSVTYTADQYGFRATGDHIPKIPEAIQRSLDFIRSQPGFKEDQE